MNTAGQLIGECTAEEPLVVVGNGDSARGKGLGQRIDMSPCVVRFNHFYLDGNGFAKDYGSTCHIHVIAAVNIKKCYGEVQLYTARTNILMERRISKGLPSLPLVNQHGTRNYFSSGYSFVTFALNLVPVIHLVGFDHASTGHYWERHIHSHNHNWEQERRHFAAYESTGRLVYLDK